MTEAVQNYYMFVGQANRDIPYVKTVSGTGITVYSFDETTAEVDFVVSNKNSDNPTYLTYSDKDNALFVTNEVLEWPEGEVTSYLFSPVYKALGYIKKQVVLGNMTAFVTLDSHEKNLLVANYGTAEDPEFSGGSAVALPVDGFWLNSMVGHVAFAGSGPDVERQGGSHPHCVLASADNRFVIIVDLGLDRVTVHGFNEDTGQISKEPTFIYQAAPAAGPRQIIANAAGDRLYLLNELDGTASALQFDIVSGEISEINTINTMPEGYDLQPLSADIQFHPNGRFIYVSNRFTDTISTLSVNQETGAIELLRCQSSGGKTPRSICVDPTGAFMAVANQDSDNICFFAIDSQSGELAMKDKPLQVGSPTCVKICRVTPMDKAKREEFFGG